MNNTFIILGDLIGIMGSSSIGWSSSFALLVSKGTLMKKMGYYGEREKVTSWCYWVCHLFFWSGGINVEIINTSGSISSQAR